MTDRRIHGSTMPSALASTMTVATTEIAGAIENRMLEVAIDGKPCLPCGRDEVWGRNESDGSDVPQGYCREECVIYRFRAEDACDPEGRMALEFRSTDETVKITYCEIDVKPA